MTAQHVADAITAKTRAVVATHLFGSAGDIRAIQALCEKHDVAVIEDCAHALDATFEGQPLGTFGRAAFFSFEIAKQINTFGGTVVTSNDPALLDHLRARVAEKPPRAAEARRLIAKLATTLAERALTSPLPYKMLVMNQLDQPSSETGLVATYKKIKSSVRSQSLAWTAYQARLGLRQLACLDGSLAARRRVSEQLVQGLVDLMDFQKVLPGADHTWYMCVARVPNAEVVALALRRNGIDCGYGEQLMQHCPRQVPGDTGTYAGTDQVLKTALQLPLHPDMSEADVARMVARIRAVISSLATSPSPVDKEDN